MQGRETSTRHSTIQPLSPVISRYAEPPPRDATIRLTEHHTHYHISATQLACRRRDRWYLLFHLVFEDLHVLQHNALHNSPHLHINSLPFHTVTPRPHPIRGKYATRTSAPPLRYLASEQYQKLHAERAGRSILRVLKISFEGGSGVTVREDASFYGF
ncbi:hypothetical protein BU23DRAFT_61108 [Bimuria novae-zelandiae CBS 107.79]|uniref:Uncharacterized protein n=1 Tax=Bimuria novae-zelandiae CBS 107.79 TaxID=1447943 RepID=A0A6A5VM92_9PLEO|nr:hypothetical protein BU23DRAFT_61108 [Bimuria novae-zelandiae CBS 107.79]